MSQLDEETEIPAFNSNKSLAEKIADRVGVKLGKPDVKRFSDGEIQININESVRGKDVYLVQSTSAPVNDNLMELLIMINAVKRTSARSVDLVVPYYGYARQDRETHVCEPITAKLVADMLQKVGADRVLSLDLHAPQTQGFFNIPVDSLMGAPLLVDCFLSHELEKDAVVVPPDHGDVTRARKLAEFLKTPVAIVDRRRPKVNVAEVMNIIGDVKGERAITIDDMIDTAGTITLASQALMDAGTIEVYASAIHAVLSGPAIKRLNNSPIKKLILTDSINQPEEKDLSKAEIVSAGPLTGETIKSIQEYKPVSPPFNTRFQSHN